MRLFLGTFCVAVYDPLSDHQRGIAVCIAAHGALGAEAERRAWSIAANVLSLCVTYNEGMTAVALSGCIAWVDSAGHDPSVPRFIFGVGEDPPLHPESSLRVATARIRALLRLEVAQVFKHQNGSPLLRSKLHNASAHQMSDMLIHMADLAKDRRIVLFVCCYDTRL